MAVLADGEVDPSPSKTLKGLLRYRADRLIAVADRDNAGRDTGAAVGLGHGIPIVADVRETLQYQPDGVLLATEPTGGALQPYWREQIMIALESGLDVVNPLHMQLSQDEGITRAAAQNGAKLWDIRREPTERYAVEYTPDGKPILEVKDHRPGSRTVLAIGTDCGIGKMTTMLEIERVALDRGLDAHFLATGQIGMMISGGGLCIDAVMSDFMNPVVEAEVCRAATKHDLVLVEGQAALNHPRFSSPTLGLLHGARPDAMILCTELQRPAIKLLPEWPLPTLTRAIEIHQQAIAWLWPEQHCPVVGVSVITAGVPDDEARAALAAVEDETGLPATDVLRYGPERLLDAMLAGPQAGDLH